MPQPRIFVSHSHHDNEWCASLVAALRAGGYDTWFDQSNLEGGEAWFTAIQRELLAREVFVVVWSPAARDSFWINEEVTLAFSQQQQKQIIPIMHRKALIEGFLSNRQHIEAVGLEAAAVAAKVIARLQGQPVAMAAPLTPLAQAQERHRFKSLDKAVTAYYATLADLKQNQGVTNELGLRRAFESLLATVGNEVGWSLIAEAPAGARIYPDATLRDENNLARGHWEAKDSRDNLDVEIRKKLEKGYPKENIIFEDTQRAVLWQNGTQQLAIDLSRPDDLKDLLRLFFAHTQPAFEQFGRAVREFKDRVPALAQELLLRIDTERKHKNKRFIDAFAKFREVCQNAIDPAIADQQIDEMLVQHLLTKRLFQKIFNNPDFTRRNVIAAEIENVIDALTSQAFNSEDFLKGLDRFYLAIEGAAQSITEYADKQHFLNTVYESFFQGFAKEQADTHGIVYTPQPIVDFMCASVEEVLRREFGTSLATPGVQILDPATGTGNFITNLIRRMADSPNLEQKYKHDLFCNEIMLLPYYIASMNIEHEYYAIQQKYEPFEGICFVDTLTLADGVSRGNYVQMNMEQMSERNTARVQKEKDATLMVIIGNPPYNVGQQSENDNNKNRKYPEIDGRIRSTYAKDSQATLNTKLYDPYVKFFRWATDRLKGHDGIVCFVSNNSFIDQTAFDGLRKHLLQDFTQIWHLDLHGNVRKNPKLSGTTHNVFGIQIGVGITIAIKASQNPVKGLWYYRVPENWRKTEKLEYLTQQKSITNIPWQELEPIDSTNQWITEGMQPEFATFLPMGTKEAKASRGIELSTIFKTYSLGVSTNRDSVVYDFDREVLDARVKQFIKDYNIEVFRWINEGKPQDIDAFVQYQTLKWSEHLKGALKRQHYGQYDNTRIRVSLYRPFCKQWLYYDGLLNDRPASYSEIFPSYISESENEVISVSGIGHRAPFTILATSIIPNLALNAIDGFQCFPLYTYAEDGSNRRENVTDWALAQFRAAYGDGVSKRDIFHYVYAVLHHPAYRARYAENLKRELPRIPLAPKAAFAALVAAGARLAEIHTNYEQMTPYPLSQVMTGHPFTPRVTKMSLTKERDAIIVNAMLRLNGVPAACFAYRLGNRSALEWVIDQYQVTTDKRSGITSDPNRDDDENYITRLVGQVVAVSLETMQIVDALPDLGLPTEQGSADADDGRQDN